MVGTLIVFLRSSDRLEESDIALASSYKSSNVAYFSYVPDGPVLERYEEDLRGKGKKAYPNLLDGDADEGMKAKIRSLCLTSERPIQIDITFASSYHAAQAASMACPGVAEVLWTDISSWERKAIEWKMTAYEGLAESDYLILDCLSMSPMETKRVLELVQSRGLRTKDGVTTLSKTTVYSRLEDLADKGLITRYYGKLRDEFKFKKPNMFYLNDDQTWGLFVHHMLEKKTSDDPWGKKRLNEEYERSRKASKR